MTLSKRVFSEGNIEVINGVLYQYTPTKSGGSIQITDYDDIPAWKLYDMQLNYLQNENLNSKWYNNIELLVYEYNALMVLKAHLEGKQMKKLVIVRGLPGSGKSTLVKANYPDGVVCSADHYMVDSEGNYAFNPKRLGYAHGSCKRKAEKAMAKGKPCVVIDNTNVKRGDFKQYLKLAKEWGYVVEYATLFDSGLTDELLAERNTHGVSVEVIKNMRAKWQELDADGAPIKKK